jgi:hypothetical protein
MKPALAYTLGVATGLALSVLIFTLVRPTNTAIPASSLPSTLSAQIQIDDQPVSPKPSTASPSSDRDLEATLKEIREAGMVVIPQELLRFVQLDLMPQQMNPRTVDTLRLDAREVSAMKAAYVEFVSSVTKSIEQNVVVTDSSEGVLNARAYLPEKTRSELISACKSQIMRALDEDSASLLSYLDFEKTLGHAAKIPETSIHVRRVKTDDKLHVTLSTRGNTRILSLSADELVSQYPSLKNHLLSSP